MKVLSDDLLEMMAGSRVMVRCNFDVPIKDGKVLDSTRIEDGMETLRKLLEHGVKLILTAHVDRPNGVEKAKSLEPVIPILSDILGETVAFSENLDKKIIDQYVARIVLLENLRFWQGEYDNDEHFVDQLASLADFYVNEAFANCHRPHASMVGVPKKLPSVAGLHLGREIRILERVRNNPDRPLLLVLGGAKLETKEPLVKAFMKRADKILVGGKIASDIRNKGLSFPEKVIVAESRFGGKDIDIRSAELFADEILKAKTAIWNGTMGVFEDERYREGTRIVAKAVNDTEAFSLVGGGDTEAALTVLDMESGIDHISTGGGQC